MSCSKVNDGTFNLLLRVKYTFGKTLSQER